MKITITRQTLDETFRLIEAAAVNGERCPMSKSTGGPLIVDEMTNSDRRNFGSSSIIVSATSIACSRWS